MKRHYFNIFYMVLELIHGSKNRSCKSMTLHSSKGLEFSCVFITGCEENLIPISLYEKKTADPEEERRLLYVGMTRAKNYLFLTNARQRLLWARN
jgi:DNA helicase-2/ATP-dependent DNA helicase PcrA